MCLDLVGCSSLNMPLCTLLPLYCYRLSFASCCSSGGGSGRTDIDGGDRAACVTRGESTLPVCKHRLLPNLVNDVKEQGWRGSTGIEGRAL